MKITIIDYGIGNLHSVIKACTHVGADVSLAQDARGIRDGERLLLPGVGAFSDGMKGLTRQELIDPIRSAVESGRPLLGICLGMQMLLTESEEFGTTPGLGFIEGRVVAIPSAPGRKVPHVGWNRIAPLAGESFAAPLLSHVTPGTMFYFVHSFTAQPTHDSDRAADTDYMGARISAVITRDNVSGCQFHPEKSGEAGLSILKHFVSR